MIPKSIRERDCQTRRTSKFTDTLDHDGFERAASESANASMAGLRVGIATSGRFHVLDLARELDAFAVLPFLFSGSHWSGCCRG
jgi:hypothetical protein